MSDSKPFEIARETLKQLSLRKLTPTPMNYQLVYSEIAGVVTEPPFPGDKLKDIAQALPTKTPASKSSAGCWTRPSTK